MKRFAETFIQYCQRERHQTDAAPAAGSWLCQCLQAIGRGLQCQWMTS
ncbi:MAG: hypothetical protein HZT40_14270 [Candidatus Thiothrix singaporensis]|uniref:Uncharacterized protein n=1 Tax=Candidatus Thiothrix singaporensis TaxID=2799669 RepID=A0A7L6ATW2_9GAMM|nr:MAG: hypothetical protein HZT40_14270 [Candidatus Thiothrix singaporensis]